MGANDTRYNFFLRFANAHWIPRIAIENPVPHSHARKILGNYTQIIRPYQFGHGSTKATCLWLKNLPELKPTKIVYHRWSEHVGEAWSERSKTKSGIANAMAEQWG